MSKHPRRSLVNQVGVIFAVPLMLVGFVTLVLVPGAAPASATSPGPGPVPILTAFGADQSAVQAWETNAEAQVATLRGVPDDLRNQLWSRGEIEADMYSQLVNMAEESNPSSSDRAVVSAFSAKYQANQEALATEAMDLYTQWNADPCSFQLPVATGYLLAPPGYQSTYQSSISNICEQEEYDPYSITLCSWSGNSCISTPSAQQFTDWAETYLQEENIVKWGTLLEGPASVLNVNGNPNNAPTTATLAQQEALTEYNDAYSDVDEGFSFLAAADSQLETIPNPTPAAAAFENVWADIAEFQLKDAGPEMTDLATENLGKVLNTSTASSILDGDLSTDQLASLAELEADSAEGESIATGLSGAVQLAIASLVQYENDSVSVALTGNVNDAKATVDLGSDAESSNDENLMLQTFIGLTMPSFTYTRADDQFANNPVQQGPTLKSDPGFCVNQGQCPTGSSSPSNTFSYSDWEGTAQTASVSKGWFVQGPISNSQPYPYEYAPSLQFLEGPTYPGSPSQPGGGPLDSEWTAWLDSPSASSPTGYQFLTERTAINAGTGYVSDYLNGCPGYSETLGSNDDNGNECVTPQSNEVAPVVDPSMYPTFAVNIDKGDTISMGGQVRQVAQAWNNPAGYTYAFVTTAPFDTDATNLANAPILIMTNPDPQTCLTTSSLGSRIPGLGPDCVLTDDPTMLVDHDWSSETVAMTPQGQGKANPELAISAPSTVSAGGSIPVTISGLLTASDPKINVSDGNTSCLIAGSGTCSFTETATTTFTATFSGDSSYFPASAQTTVNAKIDPTTTSLSSNGFTTGTYGQQVNLVATVQVDAPCVGGTVNLLDNGNVVATQNVEAIPGLLANDEGANPQSDEYLCISTTTGFEPSESENVTISTSALSVGQNQLTAEYVGTTASGLYINAPSTSSPIQFTMTRSTPVVNFVTSSNPDPGQPLKLTATVSPVPTVGSIVSFTDIFGEGTVGDGTVVTIGTAPTNANGVATLTEPTGFCPTAQPCSTLLTGTHTLAATFPGDANDLPGTSGPYTQVISGAPLYVYASDAAMNYGGQVPAVQPTYYGFLSGQGTSNLETQPTCSTNATATSAPGTYTTSCTGPTAENGYQITYIPGTMTVQPVDLSVYASNGVMTYGGAPPSTAPSYLGFVNGNSASSLTTPPACPAAATSSSTPGSYTTTCSDAVDPNYSFTYVNGTVTVEPAVLTVTASNGSMEPGGTVPTVTASYSGFVNGNTASSLPTQPSCSTTAKSSSPVGSYVSSCTGPTSDGNYTLRYVNGTTTVGQGTLVITASSGSMTYGGAVPTVAASYVGFTNGDTPASLTTAPTCTTTATTSSAPGSYQTSCSGAVDPNYTIVYVNGTTTVNPAPLTISDPSGSVVYGDITNLPPLTPTYSGFVNGDSAASLSTAPTCTTNAWGPGFQDQGFYTANVGSYSVICSGAVDADYAISYQYGSMNIDQAPLLITTQSGSFIYGARNPLFYPVYNGLVNGDTPETFSYLGNHIADCTDGFSGSAAVPAGDWTVRCLNAADPNYSIVLQPGSWDIAPAPLTITASSEASSYGAVTPAITPTYSGFVNGDGPSSVTMSPSCLSSAGTTTPPAGNYLTDCSGAANANYAFSYIPGQLTVTPVPLTITASSPTITYGQTAPAVTAGYSGFVNGDTASSLTSAPSCKSATSVTVPVASKWGTSCTGAIDPNYTISYASGVFTVKPAPLTITASSKAVLYGATPPAITPIYSGFVNGETKASLTTAPTCSTTEKATSAPGVYPSSCKGAKDTNYKITYTPGVISVEAKVSFVGSASNPRVIVTGSGFGAAPPSPSYPANRCGGTGSLYGTSFSFEDTTANWTAGQGSSSFTGNCVGLVASSWSDTRVVFSFGSSYNSNGWVLNAADKYSLVLLSSTTHGTTAFTTPTVKLTPATGAPSASVVASGAGFFPGESVPVSYTTGTEAPPHAVVICTATAATDGTYTCSGHIPASATAGAKAAHEIQANGATSDLEATSTFALT